MPSFRATPRILNGRPEQFEKDSALREAVFHGHSENVIAALDEGADVEASDSLRNTVLVQAAAEGHTEVIKILLERGAKIEANGSGLTTLRMAARYGHTDSIGALPDAGAQINAQDKVFKNTALIHAASEGHSDTVRVLLERGADVDLQNARKDTALHVGYHNSKTISVLLEYHPNVDIQNKDGCTALFLVATLNRTDSVKFLLDAGAETSFVNSEGITAEDYARGECKALFVAHREQATAQEVAGAKKTSQRARRV